MARPAGERGRGRAQGGLGGVGHERGRRAHGDPEHERRSADRRRVPSTEAASSAPAAGRSGVPMTSRAWSTAGILSPTISIRRRDAEEHERLVGGEELERGPEVEPAGTGEQAREQQGQPGPQARAGGQRHRQRERGKEVRER